MDEGKGFFADLFDFSFQDFITVRIIRVIYILGLVLIVGGAVFAFVAGLTGGATGFIFTVVLVPLGALVAIVFFRVYLELVVVVFKIGENSTEVARNTRRAQSPGV